MTYVRPSLVKTKFAGDVQKEFEMYEAAYSAFGSVMFTTACDTFHAMMARVRATLEARGPAGIFNHTAGGPPYPRANPRFFGRSARVAFGVGGNDIDYAALCLAREMTDSTSIRIGQTFSEHDCILAAFADEEEEGGAWGTAEKVTKRAIEMLVESTRLERFGEGMLRWAEFQLVMM